MSRQNGGRQPARAVSKGAARSAHLRKGVQNSSFAVLARRLHRRGNRQALREAFASCAPTSDAFDVRFGGPRFTELT